MLTVKVGNVLEDVTTYSDNKFHTIFCDPPYNLATEWEVSKEGKMIVKGKATDLMGRWEGLDENDLEVLFTEFFRVIKHGGYVCMFGIDRQLPAFNYYALKAGFEVTQSLHWFFINSFPKSCDVSSQLDKKLGVERTVVGQVLQKSLGNYFLDEDGKCVRTVRPIPVTASTSDLAKQYDGYKYSKTPFKQATETIMVFKKPNKESVIDDILSNNEECCPSCINIQEGRVPLNETTKNDKLLKRIEAKEQEDCPRASHMDKRGYYPTTVFIDTEISKIIDKQAHSDEQVVKKDAYGNLEVDNSNSCSRVLHKCDYDKDEFDLLNFDGKVGAKEKYSGSDENFHPTLKPINLIKRILTLFKLPIDNQELYIPFGGVFSEVIGAHKAGFKNITTCELNPSYVEIGQKRLDFWIKEEEKLNNVRKKEKDILFF